MELFKSLSVLLAGITIFCVMFFPEALPELRVKNSRSFLGIKISGIIYIFNILGPFWLFFLFAISIAFYQMINPELSFYLE